MMFDKLCRTVERMGGQVKLTAMLKKAALFDLKQHFITNRSSNATSLEIEERCFLPFEYVAFDFGRSAMFASHMEEIGPAYDAFAAGMHGQKSGTAIKIVAFSHIDKSQDYVFTVCALQSWRGDDGTPMFRAGVSSIAIVDPSLGVRKIFRADEIESDEMKSDASNLASRIDANVTAALCVINSPSNWVVKRENITARPVPKGAIPRSDQRPRYIVVSNDEIHRVIRDPNPENAGTVKPHRRRAHSKLLKSEKFTWKRGQRIFVKACWVGPEQAEYGGERYKVCLDL